MRNIKRSGTPYRQRSAGKKRLFRLHFNMSTHLKLMQIFALIRLGLIRIEINRCMAVGCVTWNSHEWRRNNGEMWYEKQNCYRLLFSMHINLIWTCLKLTNRFLRLDSIYRWHVDHIQAHSYCCPLQRWRSVCRIMNFLIWDLIW